MMKNNSPRREIFEEEGKSALLLYLEGLSEALKALSEVQASDKEKNWQAIEDVKAKIHENHLAILNKIDVSFENIDKKCNEEKKEVIQKVEENTKEINKNKSRIDRIIYYASGIATSGATLVTMILKKLDIL